MDSKITYNIGKTSLIMNVMNLMNLSEAYETILNDNILDEIETEANAKYNSYFSETFKNGLVEDINLDELQSKTDELTLELHDKWSERYSQDLVSVLDAVLYEMVQDHKSKHDMENNIKKSLEDFQQAIPKLKNFSDERYPDPGIMDEKLKEFYHDMKNQSLKLEINFTLTKARYLEGLINEADHVIEEIHNAKGSDDASEQIIYLNKAHDYYDTFLGGLAYLDQGFNKETVIDSEFYPIFDSKFNELNESIDHAKAIEVQLNGSVNNDIAIAA